MLLAVAMLCCMVVVPASAATGNKSASYIYGAYSGSCRLTLAGKVRRPL